MTNETHSTAADLAASTALTIGSVVSLPDGSVADIVRVAYEDIYILHRDKAISGANGAGPWVFRREELTLATAVEKQIYLDRCNGETREPVLTEDGTRAGYSKAMPADLLAALGHAA